MEKPPDGFAVPDFAASFDVDAHLASLPVHATIKGTIGDSVVQAINAAGLKPPTTKHYIPFRDYPAREILELKVEAAHLLYPDAPLLEGLRRLGRTIFPAFTKTLIGRVMYGVFGNNIGSVLKLANRSFEITQNMGHVSTYAVSQQAVRMAFTSTYTFLSSYHFGVIEGTLIALRARGDVRFRGSSGTDGEFFVAWQPLTAQHEQQA